MNEDKLIPSFKYEDLVIPKDPCEREFYKYTKLMIRKVEIMRDDCRGFCRDYPFYTLYKWSPIFKTWEPGDRCYWEDELEYFQLYK